MLRETNISSKHPLLLYVEKDSGKILYTSLTHSNQVNIDKILDIRSSETGELTKNVTSKDITLFKAYDDNSDESHIRTSYFQAVREYRIEKSSAKIINFLNRLNDEGFFKKYLILTKNLDIEKIIKSTNINEVDIKNIIKQLLTDDEFLYSNNGEIAYTKIQFMFKHNKFSIFVNKIPLIEYENINITNEDSPERVVNNAVLAQNNADPEVQTEVDNLSKEAMQININIIEIASEDSEVMNKIYKICNKKD
jgi:hypothetical protein